MIFSAWAFLCSLSMPALWTPQDLQSRVNNVKIKSFPELKSVRVQLEEVDLQRSFFATDIKNLFKFWNDREYVIRFHPLILNSNLSGAALDAILARELARMVVYRPMSNLELIELALRFHFGDEEYQAQFERAADQRTLDRGYGKGLKDYRSWFYQQLSPEEVAQKRRLYLTSEELSKP